MNAKYKNQLNQELLKSTSSEEALDIADHYLKMLPQGYIDYYTIQEIAKDFLQFNDISIMNPLQVDINPLQEENQNLFSIKIYQLNSAISLSDIIPLLENMDLKTLKERTFQFKDDKQNIWLSDYTVVYNHPCHFSVDEIKNKFKEAFIQIRFGFCENDGFNKLLLGAKLSGREIIIIRSLVKYMHQIRFPFSQIYIEKTINNHYLLIQNLVKYFLTKHDPHELQGRMDIMQTLEITIKNQLESIDNLDEELLSNRFRG
jgi:glutamate dehydrogenase